MRAGVSESARAELIGSTEYLVRQLSNSVVFELMSDDKRRDAKFLRQFVYFLAIDDRTTNLLSQPH